MFLLVSLGIRSKKKKVFSYFPGTISKFVSGLTHLTLHSSEEVNTCSVGNPLVKFSAKQMSSKIKFQCFFSTKIKFRNYIIRLQPLWSVTVF